MKLDYICEQVLNQSVQRYVNVNGAGACRVDNRSLLSWAIANTAFKIPAFVQNQQTKPQKTVQVKIESSFNAKVSTFIYWDKFQEGNIN